ncbi:MAG: hypothetical protein CVU05_00010 [Bacteroidetes bacterium HGW-Bacteroidetes-21]|nr:MAG: hypothetical protein CVU05_00010 [Bacteroidetes bacterium HGW-Bacteroidetes-21]
MSVLPLVDEFIVALDKGDASDTTEQEILSIGSDKIKIPYRVWDEQLYKNSQIFRHETNFALSKCTGDWCFYIQADEVIHEDDYEEIQLACQRHLNNKKVEGLLFNYRHFWGDYLHYLPFHGWYRNEIRIIRNHIGVESIKDAQSFRIGNRKLKVAKINAHIFHYGWVRPPDRMGKKKKEHDNIHQGSTVNSLETPSDIFNYGNLSAIPLYTETHPAIMQERISSFFWTDQLTYNTFLNTRKKLKHEKVGNKIISWFENRILNGRQLFGYKNWKTIK